MAQEGRRRRRQAKMHCAGTPEPWERWETSLVLGSIAAGLFGLSAARLARSSVHPAMSARELVLSYERQPLARARRRR